MIRKLSLSFIFLLVSFCGTAAAQSLEKTEFMVESIIPYAYVENGTVKGINIDILIEALAAVGIKRNPSEIHVYPWARAYKTMLTIPNTCTISTVRNLQREHLFKWAGPVAGYECSFITKKDTHNLHTIDDFKKNKTAAIRKAISYDTLINIGFSSKKIDAVATIKMMVQKLHYNRVDAIFSNPAAIFNEMKRLGIDTSKYTSTNTINTGNMYFAFNNCTNNAVVEQLQQGVDIIRANGTVDLILKKYTSIFPE